MRTHGSGFAMATTHVRARGNARFVFVSLCILALFALVQGAHAARGGGGTETTLDAQQALEDKFAEDFEAPIYKASQVSMDTAADVEVERKALSAKQRLAQRRRANLHAPPVFEWRYEGVGLLAVVVYVLTYLRGNAVNREIARAFDVAFLTKTSGTFRKQFHEVGKLADTDPGPGGRRSSNFSKEAPDEFKCWATGRRFLTGTLVTLKLQKRHDLFHVINALSNPALATKDTCVVECFFNPGVVQPGTCFAIGKLKNIKNLEKSNKGKLDVARLCDTFAGPKDIGGRRRVSSLLTVKAESQELACDVLTDVSLAALFGEKTFSESASERFLKTIHAACGDGGSASSTGVLAQPALEKVKEKGDGDAEDDNDSSKNEVKKEAQNSGVLRFTFDLPSADVGADGYERILRDVIDLIPHLVDAVARVRLSEQQKTNAVKRRKLVTEEDFKLSLKTHQKENADKRLDKKMDAMSDKEKAKWREKQQKKLLKKGAGKSLMRKG